MYVRTAQFYDVLHSFKDYSAASKHLHTIIQQGKPGTKTLLDVACGTGKHLECLQKHYQVEGLDINVEMLKIARGRCPSVPFHVGDMMGFDLGCTFAVITCLFSSIGLD